MTEKLQSIRGMKDILPPESEVWGNFERIFTGIVQSYGYKEIRTPVVEKTGLFKRSIGTMTDIIEKEMYTFTDRNGESLSLRPEGTAGVVRALVQHGLIQGRNKFWYRGQMFRHERPQKERYRQFYQMGCEAFGLAGPDIDAELIALSARLWQKIGIDNVVLEINSLGCAADRAKYRELLVEYFNDHRYDLDEDSRRRLGGNPLRILDSKNPELGEIIANAPKLLDIIGGESQEHFDALLTLLASMKIDYSINKTLVRGLDYYGKTVFEWTAGLLGTQGTICAGGRYDGLVEQLGGKCRVPAVGFALGVERIISLLASLNRTFDPSPADIVFITDGTEALRKSFQLAEMIRNRFPTRRILNCLGGGKFKAQFKRAAELDARFALIIGANELAGGLIAIKNMRSHEQEEIGEQRLITRLNTLLNSKHAANVRS